MFYLIYRCAEAIETRKSIIISKPFTTLSITLPNLTYGSTKIPERKLKGKHAQILQATYNIHKNIPILYRKNKAYFYLHFQRF
jgi:hypothetical protein